MDIDSFVQSVTNSTPPETISIYLKALWYDAKGNWNKSHEIIQELTDRNASWIHAYLHRKEGDNWNANYWYNRAGRNMPNISLDEEREQITKEMLSH